MTILTGTVTEMTYYENTISSPAFMSLDLEITEPIEMTNKLVARGKVAKRLHEGVAVGAYITVTVVSNRIEVWELAGEKPELTS